MSLRQVCAEPAILLAPAYTTRSLLERAAARAGLAPTPAIGVLIELIRVLLHEAGGRLVTA